MTQVPPARMLMLDFLGRCAIESWQNINPNIFCDSVRMALLCARLSNYIPNSWRIRHFDYTIAQDITQCYLAIVSTTLKNTMLFIKRSQFSQSMTVLK